MAYRLLDLRLRVGEDSSLDTGDILADIATSLAQVKDLEVCVKKLRVGVSDAEAAVDISPVTTGYFICIASDYPIMYRLNGAGATQLTMKKNTVASVNVGGIPQPQCIHVSTTTVTSLYVAPIAGAAQTANVRVVVTGDPETAY